MMNCNGFASSILICIVCSVGYCSIDRPCALRKYSEDSSVCVCNATYCDSFIALLPEPGNMAIYTSSKGEAPFQKNVVPMNKYLRNSVSQKKNATVTTFQTIKGFGGALTDAASINMMDLSKEARNNLIQSYFGKSGIEYNIVRIPMGSCDFSTRYYTYLDTVDDFNLDTFALAPEDTKLKIPLLKQLMDISSKSVSLFASPWTVPLWMKTNHEVGGRGQLIGSAGDKYHKTWAKYFTKYFQAYEGHGIKFWGVTMQNEPTKGLFWPAGWQSTGWWPKSQKDFIKIDLGPELAQSSYGQIKLMIHDDQRLFMPKWPRMVLDDVDAAKYISGIGVHWYWNWLVGPEVLDRTHNLFPDKFLLATEACVLDPPDKIFGSWHLGEKYSSDVLDNLNNWAIGWVDWNMCLNTNGGPNWVQNFVNSPIIVNGSADEFYKQPMFYHLGHFSKFILEGSVRVCSSLTSIGFDLRHVVVQRPDEYFVAVILNKEDGDVAFTVNMGDTVLSGTVPGRSIQTYVWK